MPNLRRNLFSEGAVARNGYTVIMKGRNAFIYKENVVVICAKLNVPPAGLKVDNLEERNINLCSRAARYYEVTVVE